jgi:predicted transcriptional regulator
MAKKAKKAAKSKPKAKVKAKPKATPKRTTAPKTVAKKAAVPALPKDLEKRIGALAKQMDKSFDAVVLQALCEFADAWEDHFRTVAVMVEEDERVQIVVKPE